MGLGLGLSVVPLICPTDLASSDDRHVKQHQIPPGSHSNTCTFSTALLTRDCAGFFRIPSVWNRAVVTAQEFARRRRNAPTRLKTEAILIICGEGVTTTCHRH